MTRITYIGLGRMGSLMAGRLLDAGHAVTAYDRDPAPVAALVARGAAAAESVAQAADGAEMVITCLPGPPVVESLLLGADGVLAEASVGTLVIDMSTSSPALARRIARAGGQRGVEVLDAPVSGGPPGAADGSLAIMVGGAAGAVRRARPVLEVLGRVVRHMGPAGSGQAMKLTNNLLAGAQMAALAEAVALAAREDLDPATVYEVLCNGTADSRVLRSRFPVPGVLEGAPASHDWAPLFPGDLMLKDIRLALDCAAEHDLAMPVTQTALARYSQAQEAGLGALDYSAVIRLAPEAHANGGSGAGGTDAVDETGRATAASPPRR